MDYFINNYKQYGKVTTDCMIDVDGFMVDVTGAYLVFIDDGVFNQQPLEWNRSLGSGAAYAIAAMDFGKNAKESIEYAMTRDSATGGKVKVFNIR